ncbi:MAG: ribosome small subunit-dependent GTPase A [Acidimicrobiia bacterium]|nr:ribosome small subunit-dependent GTPase A [Acidimicrobiia bacterium]MBP8181373.1 ribosome small subunit-dependent GTPase A [Acidimicrobiia bacterium]
MPETPHALADYGWNDRWAAVAADQQSLTSTPARVLRHDGHAVLVGGDDGVRQVHLRKVFPPVAVGDFVLVDGEVVVQILDRQGLLQRASADGSAAQPIAANVDVVAIVCGLDRPLRTGRIERFVTLAWDSGSVPLVVLTKADLADDIDAAVTAAMSAAPGAEVLAVSSAAVTGLDELRGLLADRTVVFVGESGAGKSSLLNALAGSDLMKTGVVRRGDHKGHHTTTARELHVLAGGIRVIDTPGVRAVGLWTDAATVDSVFDEITDLAAECRFADCAHDTEPGCAVRHAVESGALSGDRFGSWQRLRREAASAELRADARASRAANRRFGKMVKEAVKDKRPDR